MRRGQVSSDHLFFNFILLLVRVLEISLNLVMGFHSSACPHSGNLLQPCHASSFSSFTLQHIPAALSRGGSTYLESPPCCLHMGAGESFVESIQCYVPSALHGQQTVFWRLQKPLATASSESHRGCKGCKNHLMPRPAGQSVNFIISFIVIWISVMIIYISSIFPAYISMEYRTAM